MSEFPRGTVTFLFTDIEGSTTRWESDHVAMAAIVARHFSLLDAAITAHNGVRYKTVGDAVHAAFWTTPDAVAAAVEAQRALHAEPWGDLGPLRVRMALHVGIAEPREGDYLAPALNRLARLLSVGYGGQVLLTQLAASLARDALPADATLRSLGEHRLRDLQRVEPVFQLQHPALLEDFPPLKTLELQRHNLPTQVMPFIGRRADLDRVVQMMRRQDVRLVTLTGPGGVGKTRLALQVANDLIETFPDGVWFVDLAPVTNLGLVPQAIAAVLGVQEEGDRPLIEVLTDFISTRSVLLVLDNFEQIVEAAPVVAQLLGASTDSKALVTSRAPLRLRAERELPVLPLSLPDIRTSRPLSLEDVSQADAVQLFVARAQATRPDFSLTMENALTVAELCRQLDGLPLAIELAAARVRILPPKELLARLKDRLRVLTGGPRDAPIRQQTLRQTIAWSYDLLPPREQALFRRLSVFVGDAALEAVEAVVGLNSGLEVLDGLTSLVDESLIRQIDDAGSESRFGMLQSIRAFGLEQVGTHNEEDDARRAHAAYFATVVDAAKADEFGPNHGAWFDRFETEHDDLRSALRWLLDHHQVDMALRFASALWPFWLVRGYPSEGRDLLSQVLNAAPYSDSIARIRALIGAGMLAETQGEYAQAAAQFEEALTLARASGNDREAARALSGLAVVSENVGDYRRATEQLEEALETYRSFGDTLSLAQTLVGLGTLAAYPGDYTRAATLLEEAVELLRSLRDDVGLGLAQANLGRLAFLDGELDRATALSEDALAIFHRLGDKANIALLLSNLGEVAQHRGLISEAAALYEEGSRLFRELGYKRELAATLVTLAEVEIERGCESKASALLSEGLALAAEVDDKEGLARGLEAFAQLAMTVSATMEGLQALGAAEAVREMIGAPLPAVYRQTQSRLLDVVRDQLELSAFDRAWADGRERPLEKAITQALSVADQLSGAQGEHQFSSGPVSHSGQPLT